MKCGENDGPTLPFMWNWCVECNDVVEDPTKRLLVWKLPGSAMMKTFVRDEFFHRHWSYTIGDGRHAHYVIRLGSH